MKKLLAVLLAVLMAATVFAACSKQSETEEDHGNVSETAESASVITTDEAVLTNANAIEYMKLYTAEELSLSQEDYDNCSFMVAGEGEEIDGDYYVKVAVIQKNSQTDAEGNETFTFDSKGEYFIRYDAKRVMRRDLTSAEPKYEDLEVKEIPESFTATATDVPAETTAAEETTK